MMTREFPTATLNGRLTGNRRWTTTAYKGPGGTFVIASGPRGFTVYQLTDTHGPVAVARPWPSRTHAETAARSYAIG